MITKEAVSKLIEGLPAEAFEELGHYAEYLRLRSESEEWQRFALGSLARRYGPDEVEYSAADAKGQAE